MAFAALRLIAAWCGARASAFRRTCVALALSGCFGCARLIRLLEDLVNPRLEHLAELLVEGIAEGAAGAGRTGRLRGGVRAGVAGLGRRRGGRRTASARG